MPDAGGFLAGLRVLELANELGEYCGKVLAGLGADVIKVEPPGGEESRRYGPFVRDVPDEDHSLYFWHYNGGKRGITLDLDREEDIATFRVLAKTADVVIDTRPREYLRARGLDYAALSDVDPALIMVRISPFGDDGPWADYKASDLVHLALGGVAMNCGYDPAPSGRYDTPPVAPQMWHAYHLAGELTAIGILGALNHRLETGRGQLLSTAVHQAVSANTELDVPNWVYQRLPHRRQTGRHSLPTASLPAQAMTKDGRWMLPYRTYLPGTRDAFASTVRLLRRYGMEMDLADRKYEDAEYQQQEPVKLHVGAVTDALIGRMLYADNLWRDAQDEGLPWAPCRKPEENLDDDHWRARDTFVDLHEPSLDETYPTIGAKWFAADVPWRADLRAPRLDEHTTEILAELRSPTTPRPTFVPGSQSVGVSRVTSPHGKPFALQGVRVIDLSWLLASGGAGRYLAALGAEVIKVEHESRWDSMRFGPAVAPPGGRAEREEAAEPIPTPEDQGPNRSGYWFEINAGKLSASLNLKTDRGKKLLEELLADADMVIEGFSPGTMDRMGLGYERLKEINPGLIYVQQSGMGQVGTYGRLRSFGPTAQAFTGLTEMSGLPEPFPPAGIGYSYLDWYGAYNMALAMLAALYRRRVTGKGCWIDASQAETGIYLTGTAVLDYAVNGRSWQRYGNRSPYKASAPHGIYPTAGDDRWIAISCFTEHDWHALLSVLGREDWASISQFRTLAERIANQDELDRLVGEATAVVDPYELMSELQTAGVAAGVCQTAEDRCDHDPQLAHLQWMVELEQSEIGTWPVKEVPVHLTGTPAYIGGPRDRHGPSYGEDNAYVLGELLGFE